MIRGSQAITSIFKSSEIPLRATKGDFTDLRDMCLAYRFYFYYQIKKEQFEETLKILELEFFIRERTISDRLTDNNMLLKDIANNKPSAKELAKRYPHLNWN